MNVKSLLDRIDAVESRQQPHRDTPSVDLTAFTGAERELIYHAHVLMERAQDRCAQDRENAKSRFPKTFTQYMTAAEREICRQAARILMRDRKDQQGTV